MIEKDDGTVEDPYNLRRLVMITELTQIGAQSTPELSRKLRIKREDEEEDVKVSIYTMDIYQARAEPLLEGGALEVIFEDEIVNQGNVFGTLVDNLWLQVLQLNIDATEKIRGRDTDIAPLIRYHGTSREAYKSILKDGLRPTTRLGMMGNNLYYLGHYAKALRYSYADSQNRGDIRKDPILLRYAVFVKPSEVLRMVKERSEYGTITTRELTSDDETHIPKDNQWLIDSDDQYKDFALMLYGRGMEIGSTPCGPFSVMEKDTPFESLESARKALLIGDQDIRKDPDTYFTGKSPALKAYEVDSFWVPVRTPGYPGDLRYYSFTKYPEIAVVPEKNIVRLVGSFQPKQVTKGEYKEGWLRDPFALIYQLNAGRRALSRIGTGSYIDSIKEEA